MGIARAIAKGLAVALFCVVGLAAVLFGAVQTGPGKVLLARIASSLASSGGLTVEISGLGGFIPSHMSVATVTVADAKGPVAQLDGLHLAWRPLALLAGTLDVESVGATRLAFDRLPEPPPSEEAAPGLGGSFALPVRIGRLAIDEISIGEPVLGQAATLSLSASAEALSLDRGLSATFDLKRQDEPGSITGRLGYAPETSHLDLDVAAEEPSGGLVARAAGLTGLPALAATLKGSGPLDRWDGRLSVVAGDVAQVDGTAGVRAVDGARRVTFAMEADVARALPAAIAPLLEGRTELAATVTVDSAGRIAIETAAVRAAGFGAQVKGHIDPAARTADLAFGVTAGDAARFSALAPGIGWTSVGLGGTLKGALAAPTLAARISAVDLKGAGYGAGTLTIHAATAPDAAQTLSFSLDGAADGLSATDATVAQALGESATFTVSGTRPRDAGPAVRAVTITLAALAARFDGIASREAVDGTLKLEQLDLAAFSPLAGRPLAGTAVLEAKVKASGDLARADIDLQGATQDIATRIPAVDGLLGGATTLSAKLARDGSNAIRVDRFAFTAPDLTVEAEGTLSRTVADLKARLAVSDLARLDPRVSGAVTGEAAFSGRLDDLGLTARLSLPSGTAMSQRLENLSLALTGADLSGAPKASFTLDGLVAGKPASGAGAFATLADGARQWNDLVLTVGSVSARGHLDVDRAGLMAGAIALKAGNLADLSPFALTELAGTLDAELRLSTRGGKQNVAVKADAANLSAAGQRAGGAQIDAGVTDALGLPGVTGTVNLQNVYAGGVDIPRASLKAEPGASGTSLALDAVANGVAVTLSGRLTPGETEVALRLDRLNLARGGSSLANAAPANLTWSGSALTIDRLALAARGGSATVSGTAGSQLDLHVDLRTLPLSLAELATPGLGLSGTLSGTARITGAADAPSGSYSLDVARASTPDLASGGLGPLDIRAEGRLGGGRVTTQARLTGPHLQGVTLSGSAPLGAGELDLAIRGGIDLAVANPMLATSGMQVRGRVAMDATVRGTAAAPRAGGTARVTDARFTDSVNGVSLTNIQAVLNGTDRSVTLAALSARTPNGGSLTGRGQVGLDPGAGFPGRIEVDLSNAGLVNSELMRLVAEGRVAVDGAFARAPRLTGRLVVRSLDVNIPDQLSGGAAALNVRHVNGRPPATAGTTARRPAARTASGAASRRVSRSANAGMPLDLVVSAPNNVFVRGRGLAAELGGELRLSGSTDNPTTLGAFEMRRGTFDILGRRLTFSRGKISFSGTMDPDLDFVAETTANDITAQILVTGQASRPDITITSNPTLPQDEILSRVMFGRSLGRLSAAQALQVAQSVAQLSGGDGGVLEQMRRSLGVDSLELGTDAAGTGAQVGIGRRLNERMHLGVRQGTTPNSSQVTVDIDVTKNIRVQGATSADGAAEVGIGAQWDY
jgi:translocation and assembly module TamB